VSLPGCDGKSEGSDEDTESSHKRVGWGGFWVHQSNLNQATAKLRRSRLPFSQKYKLSKPGTIEMGTFIGKIPVTVNQQFTQFD
jgi:hypothetical protein